MPHFVSTKDEVVQNINDITSEFACLKVSILGKASRISGEIDHITIGPDSVPCTDDAEKIENIENEQNSCNIKSSWNNRSPRSSRIFMQSGTTFSEKKILSEEETQRKENVRKKIERHWQNMKEHERIIQERMERLRSSMARERERKSKEELDNIMAEEKRIAEQEEMRRKHEQQLHAQRVQEQKEKMEQIEDYNKRMRELEELIKNTDLLKNEFEAKYVAMLRNVCADKNLQCMLASSIVTPKKLCHYMKTIDQKIKAGDLTPADLPTAEAIIRQIPEALRVLGLEIEKIEAMYMANKASSTQEINQPETQPEIEIITQQDVESGEKFCEEILPIEISVASKEGPSSVIVEGKISAAEETSVLQQHPAVVISEETTTTENPLEDKGDSLYKYVDKDSLQTYVTSQQFLEDHVEVYKEFLQSPSTKKFRFECQKAINIPINTISGISEQHLRDKYERIHKLLIGEAAPNVQQYAHGAAFCKDILAKKIVNQGETLVSSKPKMAFAIAAITVALWNEHSDFGELLLANFYKVCPFTVPVFMPRREEQSSEDYYKSLGYKYSEDGVIEKQDKYLKRMSGIMRLYASIIVTAQRKGVTRNHPHGLQNAWRWLAATLNSEPQPDKMDLTSTLMLDILEVTGHALWNAYPQQFRKLLTLLMNEYYPRMQNSSGIGGGPLVRLEEFLKNTLTNNSIPPPDGILPPNFW